MWAECGNFGGGLEFRAPELSRPFMPGPVYEPDRAAAYSCRVGSVHVPSHQPRHVTTPVPGKKIRSWASPRTSGRMENYSGGEDRRPWCCPGGRSSCSPGWLASGSGSWQCPSCVSASMLLKAESCMWETRHRGSRLGHRRRYCIPIGGSVSGFTCTSVGSVELITSSMHVHILQIYHVILAWEQKKTHPLTVLPFIF